jgi:hypothetical protein
VDTNWFFSSLAQAAAAIVGLLGAILVAELLRQREVAARWHGRLVRSATALTAQARTVLAPRQMFVRLWETRLGAALNGPLPMRIQLPITPMLRGGTAEPRWIDIHDADRQGLEALLAEAHQIGEMFAPQPLATWLNGGRDGGPDVPAIARYIERAETLEDLWRGTTLEPLVSGSSAALRELVKRIREYDRLRGQATRALGLWTLRGSVLAIAIISITSVVYPLAQLSAPTVDERTRSILVFGGALLGLIAFLWRQIEAQADALRMPTDLDAAVEH